MRAFIFIPAILLLFSNCIINYTDFPKRELKELKSDPSIQKDQDRIQFLISRFPGLSRNEPEVRKALSEKGWKEVENYPPENGYYIDMKSSQKDPSLTAMIFLYLSYATFTILPSYSGKDGANIIFTVYKDNVVWKTFEYEITRKAFVWILTLPVLWLNYTCPTELEAYQAVIDQFESDLYSSKL
ncbi:hypothetical protein CH352_13555 [Leptospira hartskeerlii]|uniref:Uncharacterized protein n=1 Tax=Leptospira hartskeerlii TaxID=2023177 RepID=A0A2M9XA31_9LEPT|nr:hypothetical protein [Leptospira hartskeerlii]PJZ24553.1 hypothetical protein CH357_15950 [Leptospira hartskeerlii]PJZ32834.1 hypothetical protein CH352_13555 [Leptospira hartskeerlii]